MKSRGFTLIELLVVIAIIGLLATIVMVSLNTARTKARDDRRRADLKQLALAIEMYYDANGSYPDSATNSGGAWPANYVTQLSPYIKPPIDPAGDWHYYGSYRMTWAPDANCNGHYVLWAYLESGTDPVTCGFGGVHYFVVLGTY